MRRRATEMHELVAEHVDAADEANANIVAGQVLGILRMVIAKGYVREFGGTVTIRMPLSVYQLLTDRLLPGEP